MGQNMMTDNNLSKHIESRNIFCDNFNRNESLDNFLLVKQNEIHQFIPKCILYHYSFEENYGIKGKIRFALK